MSTCRRMHDIGEHVLYQENVCVMTLCHDVGGRLQIHPGNTITTCAINVPYLVGFVPISPPHLFGRMHPPLDAAMLRYIARFARLKLYMQLPNSMDPTVRDDQAALFELIHRCHDAFTEKDLTIVFWGRGWASQSSMINVAVQAFLSLRCKRIQFTGPWRREPQVVHDTKRIVEGDSVPQPLYAKFKSANTELQQRSRNSNDRRRMENHLRAMWSAVRQHDTPLFNSHYQLVQEYFEYWHRKKHSHADETGVDNPVQCGWMFLNRDRNTARRRRTEAEILQDEAGEWLTRNEQGR